MTRSRHLNSSQKIKYSSIKIFTGSDLSRRRIPFMSVKSPKPGPVLWLTACGHGDEVGGIVVVQEIFKRLRKSSLLMGSVCAFPLMNPIGFESVSRNITLSKEDLNRSFPGNKNGSLAERIAEQIFSTIIQTNPSLVLDLHNDWMKSIPYAVVDNEPDRKCRDAYKKTLDFSEKTGFLSILDTDNLRKSLSYNLLLHGIPALTLELGESYVVNEKNVNFGVKSILNILSSLRIIRPIDDVFEHASKAEFKNRILEYSSQPVSSSSGIIRFLLKPGDIVKKNQPIAKIYNSFGKLQETIVAINNGMILGHSDSSVAFPGSPIMSFGII